MFKYTVFFVIRCFASDTVPEVARCSGPKSGTERILTAVRRPFRRILRAGIFRGVRSRFVRFVGSCARHSCREGRCNLFFCFPRSACSGCRRKRGRSLSLGCLVFVRSPSPRPPGCPRARSGPHVLGPGAWYTICDTLGIELKEALWKIPKPESNPLIQTRCTIIARS